MSTDPSSKKQKLSLLAEKSQKNAPPATIDLLMQQEELWVNQILPCLGMGQFAFVGLVSKQMKHLYEEYCKTVEDPPAVVETLVYFPSDTRTRPATSTDTFYGATFCNLALAEYWHNYRYSKRYKMPWNSDVGETIAKIGSIPLLKWAREKGYQLDRCASAAAGAAEGGHLEVLKWLHEVGCTWDAATCSAAAAAGHFEILKWARENGCPWDAKTCSFAANGGHFEILKWARQHGCPWDKYTLEGAASSGHFQVFKWAELNHCEFPSPCSICPDIAEIRHLEMLKWCHARGNLPPGIEDGVARCAARGGQLVVLQWLHEIGCAWNKTVCEEAARRGHLEMLKFAHENGCPWSSSTCSHAASHGQLECLKYAREKECPWDECTCAAAASSGHLDVLKWAREHGCPWNIQTCHRAAEYGHLETLKWAHENGCTWSKKTWRFGCKREHVKKWLRKNKCPTK